MSAFWDGGKRTSDQTAATSAFDPKSDRFLRCRKNDASCQTATSAYYLITSTAAARRVRGADGPSAFGVWRLTAMSWAVLLLPAGAKPCVDNRNYLRCARIFGS